MLDKCNREIKHIRLSVTSECNYNCIYCDKEGINPSTNILTLDEITKLAQILAEILRVTRIKITGGEPLCRKNIIQIIEKIHDLNLYNDISMTTNGFYLYEKAEQLFNAGLNRINVSLCSLKPEIYAKITDSNSLNKVLMGLNQAKEVGIYPIKLNYVILRGVNENEFEDLVNFCSKKGFILQLIELHKASNAIGKQEEFYKQYHYDIKPIMEDLNSRAINIITRGEMQNRKVYILPDNAVIETITPSHEFCMGCTKLRVGCDGNLFGCLYRSDMGKNLKINLHNHNSLIEYESIVKKVINSREPYF
ncbi:MAG: GTP 3',8-cyclase MoaA [Promethearchaeota archaeon]|nr:MAG: GTP 3',8-cyclase MoaA [Candidatus Lokiarchaeota archaeon]